MLNTEKIENPEVKLEEINKQIKELENLQYEENQKVDFNEIYEKLFGTKPIITSTENIEEKQT